MKSKIILIFIIVFTIGCKTVEIKNYKVGMVLYGKDIDYYFNKVTSEGIIKATTELNIPFNYTIPSGYNNNSYKIAIQELCETGHNLIFIAGFHFEVALYEVQDIYPDVNFVILDGYPHDSEWKDFNIGQNVVSIIFDQVEAGFLVGYASAIEIQKGKAGYIGGMEIPPVLNYYIGFKQGLNYANMNNGTEVYLDDSNVVFAGNFSEVDTGKQIAKKLIGNGVNLIFSYAGGVSFGALYELKKHGSQGKEIMLIGVEIDQYNEGLISKTESIVLTSALKKMDIAAYDLVYSYVNEDFPGGKLITYDSTYNGIGIPTTNPNLSEKTILEFNRIYKLLQNREIKLSRFPDTIVDSIKSKETVK